MNYASSSLLLHEIEKSIFEGQARDQQQQKGHLGILRYIKSKTLMEDLRSDMLNQTELYLRVCDNILNEVSNFGEIHNSAQEISDLKQVTQKKIGKLGQSLPEYYVSPFLLYAEYNWIVNHSVTNFEKYYEIYTQKSFKAQRFFKESSLIEENLYQETNALVLISTQKSEFGKVLYCNNSLVNLCGGQSTKLFEGSNISLLFPPFLRAFYDDLFNIVGDQQSQMLGNIRRAYIFHKDHHLVEVDFCLQYHPYLTKGLCLNMLIRPVPVSKNTDFLLLTEDGDVIGGSRWVSKLLDINSIFSSSLSVNSRILSEQLFMLNHACNLVNKNGGASFPFEDDLKPARSTVVSERSQDMSPVNMSLKKAHELYSAFISEDQVIQLYSLNKKRVVEEPHAFFAKVQILDFGNTKIKLISLRSKRQTFVDGPPTPRNHSPRRQTLNSEDDIEDIYAPPLDEVPNVPYNFQTAAMNSPGRTHADMPPLISESPCRTSREEETLTGLTTLRPMLTTKRREIKTPSSVSERDFTRNEHLNKMETRKKRVQKYMSSQDYSTQRSAERTENRAFKAAILAKSYPKSFIWLCLIFYFVIVLTFVGQIVMKSICDDTMKNLEIRKDLLKESEERSYKGALIQINARGVLEQFGGRSPTGGIFNNLATVIKNLQIRIHDMKEANKKMLDLAHYLDEETQEKLFNRTIRITGTYLDSYDEMPRYLNAFQVTEEATNAVKTLLGITNETYGVVYQIFSYLAANLVDSFLYENREMIKELTTTVEDQKESFQSVTNLFLILNPFLLVGIGILLSSIIWNQYRLENTNMKAFIKIPPKEVRNIAANLIQFSKDLIEEETFEKKWVSITTQGGGLGKTLRTQSVSVYSKRSEEHTIRYKEFRRRYYGHIARVFICIGVLVAITIWDLITTRQAIKVIYNRENQLQFANYLSNRATVTFMTYVQLFYTNNQVKVEQSYPYDSLPILAELIKELQSEIPKKFLEADGTYNPQVRELLFVDDPTCERFALDFRNYCYGLTSVAQPINMMVAVAAFQDIIARKIIDYENADKTNVTTVLKSDGFTTHPLPNFIAIAEQAHMIAGIMDESMTRRMEEMQDLKESIIIVFSIGLLGVSLFIWVYILKAIREVYNDFKKVLQIFPPNLILSSYLLKRFLQRSSSRESLLK